MFLNYLFEMVENFEENLFEYLTSDIPKLNLYQKQESFNLLKDDIDRIFQGFDQDSYEEMKVPLIESD